MILFWFSVIALGHTLGYSLVYPLSNGKRYNLSFQIKNQRTGKESQLQDSQTHNLPSSYVILNNIQSGNNIGNICRNALAFNVSEVVIVGRKNFEGKMRNADRGSKNRLVFKNFLSLNETRNYLVNEKNCTIIGVEISDNSISIIDQPFEGSTAFIFGNEGGGLSTKQIDICDKLVYIPQYAEGGMASVNVACASAIVLCEFAKWCGYPESTRKNNKFL